MQDKKKPVLIITCGLTGTGKTTVARLISEKLGLQFIRSDVIRKELAGIPPESRQKEVLGGGIYNPAFSEKTYKELFNRAAQRLREGRSVIIDASFGKKKYRTLAAELAEESGADFIVIECICSDEEAISRLDRRNREETDASDGDREVYAGQKSTFEQLTEIPEKNHFLINTGQDINKAIEPILKRLKTV